MVNLSARRNPSIIEKLEKQRKKKIIYFFLSLGMLFFALFAILAYLQKNYILLALDSLAFLLTASIAMVCNTKQNLNFVSYFITLILSVVLLFLVYLGGVGGALAMWMFIFPISSVFLLGMKAGAYCSVLMLLVSIFFMHFLPEYGGYHYLPSFRYRFFTIFIIIFLFSAAYEIGQEKMYFFLKKYMKRLGAALALLEERQKQYKTIMDSVDHGLFLLDEKLMIQRNYSKQLLKIFDLCDDVAGIHFSSLLENRAFTAVIVQAENYLKLLLATERDSSNGKNNTRQNTIKNPLHRLFLQDPLGRGASKLLTFSFRVIYFESGLKQIFVKVSDISVSNRIKTKLEKADNQKKYESELLFEIMNSSEQAVSIFLHYVTNKIPELRGIWEESIVATKKETRRRSNQEFFSIWLAQLHAIKGNASISGFHLTSELLHRTEGEIGKINMQEKLKKESAEALRKAGGYMQKMLEHLDLLRAVADRLATFQQSYQKAEMDGLSKQTTQAIEEKFRLEKHKRGILKQTIPTATGDDVLIDDARGCRQTATNLERMISTMRLALQSTVNNQYAAMTATRFEKTSVGREYFEQTKRNNCLSSDNRPILLLDVSGMRADDFSKLKQPFLEDLQDVLIQLVKNSVVHGAETQKERMQAGKSKVMTISVDSRRIETPADGKANLVLHFYDDGRGWHSSLLQQAQAIDYAAESAVSPEGGFDRDGLKNTQHKLLKQHEYIAKKVFQAGFSTKEFVDIDAGHGLGMGMLRQRLASHRGEIRLLPLKVGVGFEIAFLNVENG